MCQRAGSRWSVGLLAALAVCALQAGCEGPGAGTPSSPCQDRITAWGLPGDLCDRQRQLRSLRLPSTVEQLGWLSAPLEELRIEDAPIRSLPPLPQSLRTVDLHNTEITDLLGLPSGIEELNLEQCHSLRSLASLPDSLRKLHLSEIAFGELENLPQGLERLSLSYRGRTELPDLTPLPRRLRELELVGERMTSLEGLPREELTSLSLQLVGGMKSAELPAGLRRLRIARSPDLRLQRLPRYLQALVLDRHRIENVYREVPYLTELVIDRAPPELDALPRFLVRLEILDDQIGSLQGLPASVRRLSVTARSNADFSTLPDGLEELALRELPGPSLPPRLGQLKGLRELDLAWSGVRHLGHLPASLRVLNLTGVSLTTPAKLPESLETLIWRAFPLTTSPALPSSLRVLDLSDSAQLSQLGPLPPELAVLRLANTGINQLPDPLPATLKELDIRGTPLRSLASLPHGLRSLTVSHGRLSSLQGLPPTVRHLAFLEPGDEPATRNGLP